MTYSNFLRSMLTYQKLSRDFSELADIGIDFYEGKYKLSELTYSLFRCSFESHYTEEGIDWISWFIFDADWGVKDFTKGSDKAEWGAQDAEGNPIAYSFESLWELLEKDYKLNNEKN